MKILVTGGAGFIGSNIVEQLENKGAAVTVLDNFSQANYKNLLNSNAEIICGDICDAVIFKKLPKFDAVIHEAAITDTTLKDDTRMMTVNFEGFKNVFAYCHLKKAKLIYASSAGVYGSSTAPMRENEKAVPHNIYAYSKLLCDFYHKKYAAKSNIPLIAGVRYFNVYGPREFHKGTAASITYQLYSQMKAGKQPRIFKYGEQKRDFIYVKDVARITIEALKLKQNTIINVGTGMARSFNDIIAALNSSLGMNCKPDYFDNPFTGFYQNYTQADTALLKKFKLETKYTLEQGISDYVKFLENI